MKKNILIVSYNIPFPINHGGAVSQYFFLQNLSDSFDFTFLTIANNNEQVNSLYELQKRILNLKLKIYKNFDEVVKVETSLAKKIFKTLKYFFTKYEIIKVNVTNINYDNFFGFADKKFVHYFNEIILEGEYDCIQFEFFETLTLIPLVPKAIKKVFIHHEIRNKKYSLYNDSDYVYKEYMKDSIKLIENQYLSLVDTIVVFNNSDKDYLSPMKEKVVVSPFGIPKELIVKVDVSECYNKLIFIGSESHYPNVEGLEHFLDTIYLPNVDFILWPIHITGIWSKKFKVKYSQCSNIIFTGILEDFENLYENAVLLSPIISGSGIRTKILQAFLNKVPVLSTKFSSEGLFENCTVVDHIMFYEDAKEFLDIFHEIKLNNFDIKNIAIKGFEYYLNNFDIDYLIKTRSVIY